MRLADQVQDPPLGTSPPSSDDRVGESGSQALSVTLTLFDAAPVGILTLDADGRVLELNRAAREMFGPAGGRPVAPPTPGGPVPFPLLKAARRLLDPESSSPPRAAIRVEIPSPGSRGLAEIYEVSASPIPGLGPAAMFVFVRDRTEQEHGSAELRDRLELAEALAESRASLLGTVSHEIRTPLNAILGITELVLDTDLDGYQRSLLTTVSTSGDSMVEMVNDVLEQCRAPSGRAQPRSEPFSLVDVVEGVSSAFAPRAYQKGLEFTATVDPTIPSALEGDGHRIRQVLVNLLGNAVKFTDRGAVSLEVVAVADTGDRLHLEFTVRDTGIGIAPEHLERIFRPFDQGDLDPSRAAEGTGLGLGITRDLLDLMGGSIQTESLEGLGSTFRVTLPLAKTSFRFPSRRASDRAFPDVTGIVVSPHAETRSACVAALSGIGAHGVRASTVQEALGHLGALSSERRIHLLLDEALGAAALTEIVREANAHDVRTTVLVAPDGSPPWQAEDGAVDHVTKPVARRQLASRLLEAAAPPRRPRPESQTHPSETETPPLVLVVDDLEINRRVLGKMLSRAGFRTEGIEFGGEVLPRLRKGGVSAVLLDLTLPDTDGLTVARAVREIPEFRSLPIIALTGHVGRDVEADCLDAGCSAYLEKPVSRALLLETLSSHRREMPVT